MSFMIRVGRNENEIKLLFQWYRVVPIMISEADKEIGVNKC